MALTKLGQSIPYNFSYDKTLLEAFENKFPNQDYWVQLNCPEFTSICPITGQPDFAHITISYIPALKLVESKSLKYYLCSFRNHGAFHEDCINRILQDLVELLEPHYLEVWGKFRPRGGISIDPYANYAMPKSKYEEIAMQRLSTINLFSLPQKYAENL